METVFSLSDVAIDEKDLEKVAECLKEITTAFSHPQETIGQFSLQRFPLSLQYNIANDSLDNGVAATTLYRLNFNF